jgi:hypothetical protein
MTSIRIGRISVAVAAAALAAAVALFSGGPVRAADGDLNACGCRQTSQGVCTCEKKSKCGCPGECEPKGCEERRTKQLEKEIQSETKKAEDAARRQGQGKNHEDGAARRDRNPDDEGETPGRSTSGAAKAPSKMTAAQRKDLAKLLGLYLAEHPEGGGTSIERLRTELSSGANAHPR